MFKNFFNSEDNIILVFSIFFAILFFIFLLPKIEKNNINERNKLQEDFANINVDVVKIDQNICSKQCCKFNDWPIPFQTVNPNIDPAILEKYIGSNMSCNNGPDGGGCVCFTKEDSNYLTNHGQYLGPEI